MKKEIKLPDGTKGKIINVENMGGIKVYKIETEIECKGSKQIKYINCQLIDKLNA